MQSQGKSKKKVIAMEKLLEAGRQLGLEGDNLRKFITERQTYEREERARERKMKAEQEKAAHERALEMKRLEIQLAQINGQSVGASTARGKSPKLPVFVDGKDELDNHWLRFERFAAANEWKREDWVISLSALLTGRVLEVYSRLSDRDAVNYDRLKEAFLSRYDLTEEGYRSKFRTAKPLQGESCKQFIVRLQNYVQKWTEMAKCDEWWPNVRSLLVKEQFVNSCPST